MKKKQRHQLAKYRHLAITLRSGPQDFRIMQQITNQVKFLKYFIIRIDSHTMNH